MVTVEIRGKQFPLCLTVAAVDEVNEKCGSIRDVGAFLDGRTDNGTTEYGRALSNTAWMLGLLIREGEEHRLVEARFAGEKVERRNVPDSDALSHLFTVAEVKNYRNAVLNAVNESFHQDIEAEHSKNVASAERS